ncbi:peptidase E [Actinoallomurus purpureus]|uniref:Type 1 glutamine amidotransferase-like domain-containing protein n=1 Tax=Actinoallomurus purpureus TaxID=478114 RepID=UPI002092844F|nr:peptidase E [Actinoallomurus purpureus]MCO6008832.1 peptidase E [Actinoallomurus purpureus]
MAAGVPTILATTMGFHRGSRRWRPGPIFDFAFELAGKPQRPRVCFIATAGGDQPASVSGFYGALADTDVRASHLALFDMPNVDDIAEHLSAQDVIWVDRGSLVNLIAVWRAHGLSEILRECWQAGVVLAGESAGSLCWHAAGTTDSFGPKVAPADGLGFLPFSNAVHYAHRRTSFHTLIGDGVVPAPGYATDIGAGLYYRGTELVETITDRAGAGAYRVERNADGTVSETALEPRRLR